MKQDFRHRFRHFVPRGLYGSLHQLADLWATLRCENAGTLSKLRQRDDSTVSLQLRSLKHPFSLRRCNSHVDGLVQNVFRREYDRWLGELKPTVIVDAGAYIGDLTCHWATRFPDARMIALEPNPTSYEFAKRNTDHYQPRITVLPAGLGATEGRCGIAGSEMGTHLVASHDSVEASIDVTTIEAILTTQNIQHIDLLKMDIEGSEEDVLANADNWIGRVTMLVVEFHGEAMEQKSIAKMSSFGFDYRRYRSLITFARRF